MPTPIEQLSDRELDALVAEKVMGWFRSNVDYSQLAWNTPTGYVTWELTSFGSFQPSTDISAAWLVDKNGWWWMFDEVEGGLSVAIWDSTQKCSHIVNVGLMWSTAATKAEVYARARCLAALRAVGVEDVEDE